MLELPNALQRKICLSQLIGIEGLVSIQIYGFDSVCPIANEDLARSTGETARRMNAALRTSELSVQQRFPILYDQQFSDARLRLKAPS